MKENRDGYLILLALVLGTAGAGIKLFYSFFPLFNVLDVLVFSLLGWLSRSPTCTGVAGLSLPPLLLLAYSRSGLGWISLQQGIGMGWVLSALLVPLAAGVGLYLSRGAARVRTT
jgi:predicted membrane channel-forming protein YqfA (hemolysin III family)